MHPYLLVVLFIDLLTEIYLCVDPSLRRMLTAARWLGSQVRIPPVVRMFVRFVCCVSSGRGLCDGLITCPGESYRLWRVAVCDRGTS